MLSIMRKHGLILAAFAALFTGLTAMVHALTEPAIEQQAVKQQQQLFDQVVPPSLHDNDMLAECYLVTDAALGNRRPHRLYLAPPPGQSRCGGH